MCEELALEQSLKVDNALSLGLLLLNLAEQLCQILDHLQLWRLLC